MFYNCQIDLCIFCYKNAPFRQNAENKRERDKNSVQNFYKLLGRFVQKQPDKEGLQLVSGLNGCKDCDRLIRNFCKVYHKIKCLELDLIRRLENLGSVMK